MSTADGCSWPQETCAVYALKQSQPDQYGRVWMHCASGLSYSKASMARFMMFCLGNNVEIGSIRASNPQYKNCTVMASVRLLPSQFAAFEAETGGKLSKPATINLN